ncbi:hypothetical protein GCM10028803_35530 [Larkinella knui]|nr:vanadium-dependent haloperoxidase [Larkinella knui]
MTEVMIHDVTNPPLAARFFTYACLAGYEVIAQNDKAYRSMHGVLNDYPAIEKPQDASGYATHLSAILAMLKTAQKIQPSGNRLEALEKQLVDSCRTAGFSDDVITRSTNYAVEISKQILKYAKADRYNRISNYPRYTPSEKPGSWYPTPPGYFAPVEPYFNTVRPFTLDSAAQFKPAPPAAYSTDTKSAFYRMLLQNQQEGGATLAEEHRQIAAFWDCNPFALENNGHMLVGLKKISPGAHWMGITGIACAKAKKSFAESLKIYTAVAIGLTDGFICCWDEKYRSNRIRPETAIRKLIDPDWKPFLQTPPFPEYLSGHSTISSASEVILTHYFGDHFVYTDTVEERYGLKARSFHSFREAAIEAGLSRFYGGIHFMDAIDQGRAQGLKVGEWVVKKVEK